jgi:uncharacterized Ntn-hydrolase superfamily protein
VLRIHDHAGKEIGGRIDGNIVAGRIPISKMISQFEKAKTKFSATAKNGAN